MEKDPLFIGVYPGGLVYCDRRREVQGDYVRVAFLSYTTLALDIEQPDSDLLPRIWEDVTAMQERRGQEFEISACGHTVKLGGHVPVCPQCKSTRVWVLSRTARKCGDCRHCFSEN